VTTGIPEYGKWFRCKGCGLLGGMFPEGTPDGRVSPGGVGHQKPTCNLYRRTNAEEYTAIHCDVDADQMLVPTSAHSTAELSGGYHLGVNPHNCATEPALIVTATSAFVSPDDWKSVALAKLWAAASCAEREAFLNVAVRNSTDRREVAAFFAFSRRVDSAINGD
jgi:hypothetical protein